MLSALFNFRYQNMPTHKGICIKKYMYFFFFFGLVEIGFCDVSFPPTLAPPWLAHLLSISIYSFPIDLLCVYFGTHSFGFA